MIFIQSILHKQYSFIRLLLLMCFLCPACDIDIEPVDNETDKTAITEEEPPTNAPCEYAISGMGALMAKKSGNSGWGYTKDLADWQGGGTGSKEQGLNVGFVVAVDKNAYPYVAVAWQRNKSFCADLVHWRTREVVGTNNCAGNSVAIAIPQDTDADVEWYNLIIWLDNDSVSSSTTFSAAVGITAADAIARAKQPFN